MPGPATADRDRHKKRWRLTCSKLLGPVTQRTRWAGVNLFGPRGSGRVAVAHALAGRLGLGGSIASTSRGCPPPARDRAGDAALLAREASSRRSGSTPRPTTPKRPRWPAPSPTSSIGARVLRRREPDANALRARAAGRADDWILTIARRCGSGRSTGAGPSLAVETDVVRRTVRVRSGDGDAGGVGRGGRSRRLRGLAGGRRELTCGTRAASIVLGAAGNWRSRSVRSTRGRTSSCPTRSSGSFAGDRRAGAHRTRVYEEWGFGAKLARGRGISALFSGASGTGKTMAAEILADELELDLYRIDLAGVVSKYIGETEKNLRRVFDAAEAAARSCSSTRPTRCSASAPRSRTATTATPTSRSTTCCSAWRTTRAWPSWPPTARRDLDHAFLRRLRFVVDFPFPDAAAAAPHLAARLPARGAPVERPGPRRCWRGWRSPAATSATSRSTPRSWPPPRRAGRHGARPARGPARVRQDGQDALGRRVRSLRSPGSASGRLKS